MAQITPFWPDEFRITDAHCIVSVVVFRKIYKWTIPYRIYLKGNGPKVGKLWLKLLFGTLEILIIMSSPLSSMQQIHSIISFSWARVLKKDIPHIHISSIKNKHRDQQQDHFIFVLEVQIPNFPGRNTDKCLDNHMPNFPDATPLEFHKTNLQRQIKFPAELLIWQWVDLPKGRSAYRECVLSPFQNFCFCCMRGRTFFFFSFGILRSAKHFDRDVLEKPWLPISAWNQYSDPRAMLTIASHSV